MLFATLSNTFFAVGKGQRSMRLALAPSGVLCLSCTGQVRILEAAVDHALTENAHPFDDQPIRINHPQASFVLTLCSSAEVISRPAQVKRSG